METVPFEIVNFVGRWSLTFYNCFIIVGQGQSICHNINHPMASGSLVSSSSPGKMFIQVHPWWESAGWKRVGPSSLFGVFLSFQGQETYGNQWKSLVSHWKPILILIQHPWPIYDKRFEHETNPPVGWSSDLQRSSLAFLFCVVHGPTTQSKDVKSIRESIHKNKSIFLFLLSLSLGVFNVWKLDHNQKSNSTLKALLAASRQPLFS